jgi:sugar-specific transcriptional regulator TrmB
MKNILKKFGLSSFEQKAYLGLLKGGGGLTAQEMSNVTNIPITRVYSVMKQLVKSRLVSIDRNENPTRFDLENPEPALRFMLSKYFAKIEEEAKALEDKLENILKNLEIPTNIHKGCDIYDDEDDVESLIPSLMASSKEEVLIISHVTDQIYTKGFIKEFINALEKGITVKILITTDPRSPRGDPHSAFIESLTQSQQARVAMNYWGKRLFLRKYGMGRIEQFAIFDGIQVAYSVKSPRSAEYFATLLIENSNTVNEFYEDFQKAWQKATEIKKMTFDYPSPLAAGTDRIRLGNSQP